MSEADEKTEVVTAEPVRNKAGQFVKGASGNPLGRPKGSRNRATILRELLDEAALDEVADAYVEVVSAMVHLAKNGDVQAAKFVKSIADIVPESEQAKAGAGKIVQVYIDNRTQKD